MSNAVNSVRFAWDGLDIEFETGGIARQADAAVLVKSLRSVVLVTVVSSRSDKNSDFLPLTVEYREKAAAAGRIPGGFQRREGRISDDEILASRILDRSIRPLFAPGFYDEVQVQASVLSFEPRNDEEPILALLGVCAALHLSALPWSGPLAGVRLVRTAGEWRALPTREQRRQADVDLVVSAGAGGLVMVEGSLADVPESVALEGLAEARRRITTACKAMEELRAKAGLEKTPVVVPQPTPEMLRAQQWVEGEGKSSLTQALATPGKQARAKARKAARKELLARAESAWGADDPALAFVPAAVEQWCDTQVRERTLAEGVRLDGRALDAIRPISAQVNWLPTPHGSALFTRGETQAMVTCTLGPGRSEQLVDTLAGLERRRFLLHYNFPPYSVGETRAMRGPGRREIGHGNLARRALEAVVPSFSEYPYVVRLESEISESNGSSSMATVCGGCLALLDAGVPMKAMVAGIAMGLICEGERFAVLSDILGDEDHLGDMDFKVAGSECGITALQMDNKIGVLPDSVLEVALEQARRGRLHILAEMRKAIAKPREQPKPHVPRVISVPISVGSLGELIGPRGANLREMEESYGVEITVEEAAERVLVFAGDGGAARQAVQAVRQHAGVVQEGKLYKGVVTGVKDFGAFVQIFQSAEGLVHVSEWERGRVDDLTRSVQEGDDVVVRVLGVEKGKLRLSRAAALDSSGEDVVNA